MMIIDFLNLLFVFFSLIKIKIKNELVFFNTDGNCHLVVG